MNDSVTDSNADVPPAGEVPAAGETDAASQETLSVDSLLAEYDEQVTPLVVKTPDTPAAKPAGQEESLAPVDNTQLSYVTNYVETQQKKETQQDIKSAVDTIKGANEVLKGIPDTMIRGHLHDLATGDTRFLRAFQDRHSNPGGWNKILGSIAGNLAKEVATPVDENLSDTMSSLRASVNTGSPSKSDGPSDEEVANMTDQQFNEYVASKGGSNGPSYVLP